MKKYEFVPGDEIIIAPGRTLKRIRALVTIAAFGITPGTTGGYIEGEANLAQVYGNAWVSGNARVYGNAWVSGDAQVYGDARVYGNARVYGDAQVSPVHVGGLRWPITIADTQMVIGCQAHDITRWWRFSDAQIAAMDSDALDFWKAHKVALKAVCDATGRPLAKATGAA